MELFETERIVIRPFRLSDLKPLSKLMEDPLVMEFTGFRKPQTRAKISELLDKWTKEGEGDLGVWAAVEKENGSFVGWFMLKTTISEDPELGFMLSRDKWNKGFATEIANGFLKYASNSLMLKRVIASTDKKNESSISVLKKIGMMEIEEKKADENIQYYEKLL